MADIMPPSCPICGQPAQSEQVRVAKGVATGDYLCPVGGHIWRTTWLQPDTTREVV